MRDFCSVSVLFTLCSFLGCASLEPTGDDPMPPGPSNPLVEARPYDHQVPAGYDAKQPTPLIVMLHGYGANGVAQDVFFGLGPLVDRFGFLFAYPNGTVDKTGKHFWNATDACCNFDKSDVDDVAYVEAVISDMKAHYNVDPRRVFLVGHSNGGFMSHRFACERSRTVAAFVALAGVNFKDQSRCKPEDAVAVLQVHGDADAAVPYTGGTDGMRVIPSAEESTAGWAMRGGCQAMPDRSAPPLDLEVNLAGDETTVARWSGCRAGGGAELWRIQGGSHLPNFRRPFWGESLWKWLSEHPKPMPPN